MNQKAVVKNLTLETAKQQGHGECTVTVSESTILTAYVDDEYRMEGNDEGIPIGIPEWTVHVTRGDNKSTQFFFEMPEDSEDKIRGAISENLARALWQ